MDQETTGDESSPATPTESEPASAATEAEVAFAMPTASLDDVVTQDTITVEVAPVERAERETGREMAAAIGALGARLDRRLDELQNLFHREIRAEATREKVVDRLHAELQEYKQDLLLNTMRPVFIDLIQLHDDIGKMVAAQSQSEGEGKGEVRRLLDIMLGYQQGIEDILYRQGIEPYLQEGDIFDPRRQRAVAAIPTDDPTLARTIAARHRKGFQTQGDERVIRPEIVSVYALKRGG
jgi:molecular chaperone GrpE